MRAVEEIVALGVAERPSRTSRPRPPQAPELAAISGRLSDLLETRVSVDMGRRRGKLVVEFASAEDLERIVGQIAPQALSALQTPQGQDGHHGHEGHGATAGSAARGRTSALRFASRKRLRIAGGERIATNSPVPAPYLLDDDYRHWPHVLTFDGYHRVRELADHLLLLRRCENAFDHFYIY